MHTTVTAGGYDYGQWRKGARSETIVVVLDALVPQDHLLWKLEIRPVFATITADPAQNPLYA